MQPDVLFCFAQSSSLQHVSLEHAAVLLSFSQADLSVFPDGGGEGEGTVISPSGPVRDADFFKLKSFWMPFVGCVNTIVRKEIIQIIMFSILAS